MKNGKMWMGNHHLFVREEEATSKIPVWVVLVAKNPSSNAREARDTGSVSRSGRSPGGGHGNPLKYSSLENPMDGGAWWATVHGAQSRI